MKRNCNNCKALKQNLNGVGYYCQLNHNIQIIKELYGIPISYKPLEDCKKPITSKEYVNYFINNH